MATPPPMWPGSGRVGSASVFVYQLQNLNNLLQHRYEAAAAAHPMKQEHYPIAHTHLWHCIGLIKEMKYIHDKYIHTENREIHKLLADELGWLENFVNATKTSNVGTKALKDYATLSLKLPQRLDPVYAEYERLYHPDPEAAYREYMWNRSLSSKMMNMLPPH